MANSIVDISVCEDCEIIDIVQSILQEAVDKCGGVTAVRDALVKHAEPGTRVPTLPTFYKVLKWDEGQEHFTVPALFRVRDAALLALKEG